MPIVFARVDDRLIHGQIVQAWLPQLNVDEVIIPCTKRNRHNLNEGLLRLSLPYEYDLSVMEAEKISKYAATSKRRIFLLMASLQDLSDLITNGVPVKNVNIGGMHFKEGAQKLADHVFLDEQDKQLLKLARDLGISIETRAVPNDISLSLKEVLRER
ncbi:PTS system mannose/fructose/N-acetylgalactosamine-transporter subunit IIB [Candidatus Avelusimicrobium caledoniensis]|uniref:PTS system mannose/fructose/N-acetylgalactosamine-transporter subunit IIB n=1 Tax=Candidatus Avelusimicrobium caledoniensis TaxID=3416220 RepID=UPI003D0E598E